MSDLKPSELTQEERAIVDALFMRSRDGGWPMPKEAYTAERVYEVALEDAEPIILARRALFAPPASEEKVTCPNCKKVVASYFQHQAWNSYGDYIHSFTCQPAQPEPAATVYWSGDPENNEEPAAPVKLAAYAAEGTGETLYRREPAAPEMEEWRNIAQPVTPPLAMSEEMRSVLECASIYANIMEERGPAWHKYVSDARRNIAAVRAQGTATKVVKMEKVREAMALLGTLLFEYQQHMSFRKERGAIFDAALAELNAHEGRRP